jgi:crotonobetainyl-CoA:carnitine CoA-transferase CaiB-like acyl-CoA transferase
VTAPPEDPPSPVDGRSTTPAGAPGVTGERYLPLAGVRVLDLTRLIAGDLATRQLADFGAEVVKVEDPVTGDYQRVIPPFANGGAIWHELLNRNKKSVALDITDERDRDVILRLVDAADAVVEVSRPGGLLRLGIDVAECRRRRPSLVVCSISAFGQTGPWANMPAHGLNMDGMAGMTATVEEDGETRFVQLAYTSFGNELGAVNAALAVTAAVLGARTTGQGVWIDISCWDCVMDMNRTALSYLEATGRDVQIEERHLWGSKHCLYRAADDRLVFIAVIEKKFWERFCEALDRPDLATRWDSETSVDYGAPDLRRDLEPIMASRTAAQWLDFFLKWGLPGSPMLTLAEIREGEHFAVRGLLEPPAAGRGVPNVPGPIRWIDRAGDRPGRAPQAAPRIGEHTEEVLSTWLGDS